jgi:ferritin-like metal-binding protein YciE
MNTLQDVLVHELKDLYSAEQQLTKSLPKMAAGAQSDELRQAFNDHLALTQMHVDRLDRVAASLNASLRGHKCKGMKGLIDEGSGLLTEKEQNSARDVALISSAQRVEHYEIAAYGSAVAFARLLGADEAAALLQLTLDEEKSADVALTELAMRAINPNVMWTEDRDVAERT